GRYGKVAAALAPAPAQKTVLGQPGIELLTRYLQEFGSVGFVVASDLQSPLDELAFGLVEGLGRSINELADRRGLDFSMNGTADRQRRGLRLVSPDVLRQILEANPGAAAKGDRAFDRIGKFTHIAWPWIPEQRGHRVLRDTGHRDNRRRLGVKNLDEVAREQGYVFGALAQWRDLDDIRLQPVVQILTQQTHF